MEAVFDDNPGEHNSIKYQMSWPGTGDPYYFSEGGDREPSMALTLYHA
jgi:hypothetical protein